MTDNERQLGLFLLGIIVFFSGLIFILVKIRKENLRTNLEIKADEIWAEVVKEGENLNFLKSDLLFGIWQDHSGLDSSLVIKNTNNESVGRVIGVTLNRQKRIELADKKLLVEYPLSWNRTAILYSENGEKVLARYSKIGWLNRHEIEVTGLSKISARPKFTKFRLDIEYIFGDKFIGIRRNISANREVGRLIVVSKEIPIEVRIFMLLV